METIELHVTPRDIIGGKQVKAMRRQGLVPGIIYGKGIEPLPVTCAYRDIEGVVKRAGSSTLVRVFVEGVKAPYVAIVRDVQYHPIRRTVQHVDFQALKMEERVRVPVSIILTGESKAVTDGGGTLLHHLTEVEIECLPDALIHNIKVDVSAITKVGQSITVGDLQLPEDVTILTSPDEIIAQVVGEEGETSEESEASTEAES